MSLPYISYIHSDSASYGGVGLAISVSHICVLIWPAIASELVGSLRRGNQWIFKKEDSPRHVLELLSPFG